VVALGVVLAPHVPSAAAQPSTSFWSATAGVQGSWYDNPRNATIEGQPGYVAGLGAGLGYTLDSPRTQFQFTAHAAAVAHEGTGAPTRVNYVGGLNFLRHATPRLTLRLSEDVSSRYTSGSAYLAADGLIYPVTLIRTNTLVAGLSYEFSKRTSLSVTARHDWVGFDETSGLKNGWQFQTGASLDRRLTPTSTVSLSYSYRHSRYETSPNLNTDTHSVTAGWAGKLNERLTLSGSGGVSQINRLDGGGKLGLVGGAALTQQFQKSSFSFRYSHGYSQAFGYSRDRVHDTLGLDYSRRLGRNLGGSLAGVYGRSRDPYDPLWGGDTQNYSAGLQYSLPTGWTWRANYAWLCRTPINSPSWSTNEIHGAVSYGWQWR
jgi:hypothetical protein